jgi:curved DNA-binding protein
MAVKFKDYYEILGVPRNASQDEIKKAFRRLAREYHPDVAKDKKLAEEKFKEINEAYEVLGNPENRKKYDELGRYWQSGQGFNPPHDWDEVFRNTSFRGNSPFEGFEFRFGGTGFSDFFEQFFGSRSSGIWEQIFSNIPRDNYESGVFSQDSANTAPPKGKNIEGDIMVTLNEVLNGVVKNITVRWQDPHTNNIETHTYKVRIPKGVQEGQKIRLAGKGEQSPFGGEPGDIILTVKYARHPYFEVMGKDLIYELDLAPWEAVLGTTVEIPTLDGKTSIKIPPGTQSGQKLRIKNKGLPDLSGQTGDLYAIVSIRVPQRPSEQETQLWKQLAKISDFNPRK